jgi:FkbM family methyltransferase
MDATGKVIFDVGAHRGEDTDFYLKKGFSVVAVEANPALCLELSRRFDVQIRSGQLTLVNCAIAETAGPIDFYVNQKHSTWGTAMPKWARRNEKMGAGSDVVKVRAEKFASILSQYGMPYYLKIDIEGADLLCIKALEGLSAVPRFVSLESTKDSWAELLEEFELLTSLGYSRFKVVRQANQHKLVSPNPPLEGLYAPYRFVPASSGLFGDELPGKWLTKDQAIGKYRGIFLRYRLFGDNTVGSRLLSRIPILRTILSPQWYDTHASQAR